MSWKPEFFVDGAWHQNALVFATEQEARDNARDLFCRWTLCTDHRAARSTDPINYAWKDGALHPVPPPRTVEFDRPKLKRLMAAIKAADAAGTDMFTFEGNEYVVGYARYLAEYLEGRLP